MIAPVSIVGAFLLGAVPFAQLAAQRLRGIDLRRTGSGTVSGTALFRVAGFPALAVTGLLDIAKGAAVPWATLGHPSIAAMAGGAAAAGHNWSPFLRGAGGRGVAPALGALAVQAWPGVIVLGLGLAVGRLAHHTGLGTFVAMVVLVPVLALTGGRHDALAGLCLIVPMVAKRLAGNRPSPRPGRREVLISRLLYDRDPEWST